jgi:hypothetical protein
MAIHATWNDHALLLWGGLSPAAPLTDSGALRDLVGQLTPDGLLSSTVAASTVTMRLPGDENGAVTDCPAVADRMGTYEVPVLRFSPAEAMDLLLSLSDPLPLPCADTLKYWGILARFARDAILRQRFYPTATRANAHHEASWRLQISGAEELERLERFSIAMPPACGAIIAETPPAPLERIDSFLADTSDALIRRAAGTDPFFTRVHQMAKQPGAGPEIRLLSALLSDNKIIPGEARENDVLVDQIQLWTSRLGGTAPASGWQLSFELHEPDEQIDEEVGETAAPESSPGAARDGGAAIWRVTFGLIPLGEGKEIDAEELWTDSSPLTALGRQLPELRAVMMAELSRAVEFFPPLSRIIGSPAPAFVDLSTIEAQQFLRQWSAELNAQSFAVALPSWADESQRRLSLVMALRPLDEPGAPGSRGQTFHEGGALAAGPSRMGLDSLLEFNWRISLGGMELTPAEFEALVRRQSPLVQVRGKWVEIDADLAAAAQDLMERQQAGQTTLGDAFRAAFATGAISGNGTTSAQSAPPVSLSGSAWVKDLLDQLPGMAAQQIEQPGEFEGTLRPYQLRGLQWLAFLDRLGIGGCLADDMGLGKTIQLISLLLHERQNGENSEFRGQSSEGRGQSSGGRGQSSEGRGQSSGGRDERARDLEGKSPRHPEGPGQSGNGDDVRSDVATHLGPTLLFAPTSVVGNWTKELQRFAPELKVLLHHGPQRNRGLAFVDRAKEVDVVITSYALAHRDREDFARMRWHRLALDEAQKIKNPSAASSVAIRSLSAPRRVALTGTPIENHLSELWSIMDVLNPGLLGTARDFRERFAVPIEKLLDRDRSEHLRRMIRPFVLRRTKNDPEIAGDLPDKIEMKVYCNLTVEQAAMYERATSEMLGQIDAASGIRRRGLILAVLTRLKQICDHPALVTDENRADAILDRRSGKSERLVEMLEEVTEEGDSALVFTQYAQMGHLLHRLLSDRLPKSGLFYLHGGTPQKQRDEMVRQFQESPKPAIFILSLRAGGLGLNLTAASHVFHYDRWWNPAIENQATDRAHRIGQTRQVQVHKFIAVGTVEERIDKLLSEKTQLAESIVGAGDEWLTDLSTNELREYLKLSDEAVGEF